MRYQEVSSKKNFAFLLRSGVVTNHDGRCSTESIFARKTQEPYPGPSMYCIIW